MEGRGEEEAALGGPDSHTQVSSFSGLEGRAHGLLWLHMFLGFPPSFGNEDFSSELTVCIRWPEYLSFSFSISHSNEYSGLISFRID